jgi:hypothetical protein
VFITRDLDPQLIVDSMDKALNPDEEENDSKDEKQQKTEKTTTVTKKSSNKNPKKEKKVLIKQIGAPTSEFGLFRLLTFVAILLVAFYYAM